MITLQFPKLDKALIKPDKSWKDDDPRRGITVLQNNAIVFSHEYCLVVNLFDYFTIDFDIEDEEEIKELKRILFFMNGKSFSKDFWEELTKGANMKMKEGKLFLESPRYAKDLYYKEAATNLLDPLTWLSEVSKQEAGIVGAISMPMRAFLSIGDTLKAQMKLDHIVMDFTSQDKPVRFTFKNRRHFFGYILPHYDSAQEGFRFENLRNFVGDEIVKDQMEEARALRLPPPPPAPTMEVVKDSAQTDMFGGNINAGRLVPLDQLPNTGDDDE